MKNIRLTTLFLFAFINTIVSQNTLELIALDHNSKKSSITHISEINFKILTKHKTIAIDPKMFFPVPCKFETFENKVKIEYQNIFNQTLDTTYIITSKKQKIYLLVDKMKDYEVKTFIETSLLENKKWNLDFSSGSCGINANTKLQIIPRENNTILKYKIVKKWNGSGKKIKEKNVIKLSKNDLDKLIIFEKKLRLLNDASKRCMPATYYYLTLGNNKLKFKDETCTNIYNDFLKELIERNN
ncbi:hypothetical protein [Winogradskyella sp.]|uniref:hypothetical protein n=1 Tax=Winogradskyella sp. TaxID=1883156 RepID=UPI003AB1BED3